MLFHQITFAQRLNAFTQIVGRWAHRQSFCIEIESNCFPENFARNEIHTPPSDLFSRPHGVVHAKCWRYGSRGELPCSPCLQSFQSTLHKHQTSRCELRTSMRGAQCTRLVLSKYIGSWPERQMYSYSLFIHSL